MAIAIFSADPILRRSLEQLLREDPAITVVGVVDDPSAMLRLIDQDHVDAVLADAPPREQLANWRIQYDRTAFVVVPTANPKQLTDIRESVDSAIDERSLPIDLVRVDRAIPVAGCVGSRNPRTSASTERSATQIPEASDPREHRPAVVCWALSPVSQCPGGPEDYEAGDADTLAPRWFSSLLALEIPTARRPAEYIGGNSLPHPRDERRKPTLGCSADTRRTAQARHRCRTDHGCKVHGKEEGAAVAGLEDLSTQSCRDCVNGFVRGPDDLVSAVVWILDLATQAS